MLLRSHAAHRTSIAASVLVLLATLAAAAVGREDSPSRVATVRIPAPSLRGNRLDTPDSLPIAVCVPPDYATSQRRYPAVYFLPGFGDRVRDFVGDRYGFALPDSLDGVLASGEAREMILVVVNGFNGLGGSFYARSPAVGDWESWVADDAVRWVDQHYRTLPRRESRGLAGHSMGGAGALCIGMHRPDVFGAVYAMSPGVFAPGGLRRTVLVADSTVARLRRENEALAGVPSPVRLDSLAAHLATQDWSLWFAYAYGAAFSPDTTVPPPCVRFPWPAHEGGAWDARIEARWEAGFGDVDRVVRTNARALRALRGLGIEYGDSDELPWIPEGCRHLSSRLAARGIRHALVRFAGAHDDRLGARLQHAMLPFFSRTLVFE